MACGFGVRGICLSTGVNGTWRGKGQGQRQHPVARQTPAPEGPRDSRPPRRQLLGQFDHSIELLLRTLLLPGLVVEVLAASGRVGADGLDMTVRVGRNPHLLPRRWDHQILDPSQGVLVGEQIATWRIVGKSFAPALARDPGLTQHAATQPHTRPPFRSDDRELPTRPSVHTCALGQRSGRSTSRVRSSTGTTTQNTANSATANAPAMIPATVPATPSTPPPAPPV